MGHEVWEAGGAYEAYVGRWSRLVADEFVAWLDVPPGRSWLDVGCGTGALTAAALGAGPARVTGIDRSTGFLTEARYRTGPASTEAHPGNDGPPGDGPPPRPATGRAIAASVAFDEGRRLTMCAPGPLAELWAGAGFGAVESRAIDVPTVLTGFADFWQPFLGGQGSAPGYVASLPERRQTALRDLLPARLPAGPDGTVRLTARAWAVQGKQG
jgi:hypothetical protein